MDLSAQHAAWVRMQRDKNYQDVYRHVFPAVAADDEDSICRLGLPRRMENMLRRAGIDRISLLLDIESEDRLLRPPITGVGHGSWDVIEEMLDRPLPPRRE